jgi:hypothetical protein
MTTTEIRIDEHGDETHESWLLITTSHVSSTPGARLFDSEIPHQHYIVVTVKRCTRKRDLSRDWLYPTKVILEMSMSQAQWGAFVSSFGQGGGVPATLNYLLSERVPSAPPESRLHQSHQEVKDAGTRALAHVQDSFDAFVSAFETQGKKAQRAALSSLESALANAPLNMEFAASSLTEHVENVVTKAQADIDGMVAAAMERGELVQPSQFQLTQGDNR